MSCTLRPLRYAHAEGHVDLAYSDSGRHLVTCGSDGDVRVYEGFEDDDPTSQQVGDVAYAVACKNDRFYAAADDNSIQTYHLDSQDPDGLVTRFVAPVTHICFSKNGKKLVAGSSDFTIKVVNVDTSASQVLTGHDAPVLSVALHPKENLVASSSCDGTVRIWEIEGEKCIHSIPGLAKNNDFGTAVSLVRLTWSEDGRYLVIPFATEIRVYDMTSWQISFILSDSAVAANVGIVCFSPCWRYLAASCANGAFVFWDFAAREVVSRAKHPKGLGITALKWNPVKPTEVAYCDNNGQLGLIDNAVPDKTTQKPAEVKQPEINPSADLFDDDDDDMLIEATNTNTAQDPPPMIADDDDDDDDFDIGALKKKFMPIEEDSNAASVSSEKKDGDTETEKPAALVLPPRAPEFEPTPLQPPFQSSSTPSHLSHRFMVWNSVGIIIQYNTEEENSINVEFHDTAVHHALHITNTLSHSLAALSQEALILACESDDDRPSQLACTHFAAWDGNKEWNVEMPEGEDIKTICLGDGWAAAGTNKRMVRIFTVGGIQRETFAIAGPVVTVSGHGNQLLVVYHQGMGIPGDQNLGLMLLNMATPRKWTKLIAGDPVPLSPKSTLAWAGFSAEGTPFIMDSAGIVRMLSRQHGYTWMQVANLKKLCKGKSDNYWICGLHENPQQIRAILCKGGRYPATVPRPMVQILSYQLPMCDAATDKGTIEESFWRNRLLSQHLTWWDSQGFLVEDSAKTEALMPQQESLMKMFALACKSEREVRAVELCQLMPNYRTVQLAIKYASRLRMMTLAQRLNEVAREKAEEEAVEAQKAAMREQGLMEEEEEEEVAVPTRRTAPQQEEEEEEEEEIEEAEEVMEEADNDEEQENKVALKFGANKTTPATTPKTICTSQKERKNPFKVSTSQQKTTPVAATKGSSVFDAMGKPKSKAKESMSLKNKAFVFPKKSKKTKSDGDIFRKRKRDSVENPEENDEDSTAVVDEEMDLKSNKISRTESNPSENTSMKLKGFAFGKS